MPFNTPSYEEIVERNAAGMKAKFENASLLPRSFLFVFVRVLAMAEYSLYGFGQWVFKQIFVETADEENLERHAKNKGQPRKEASFAKGSAVFTGNDGVTVPKGTELKRADGEKYLTLFTSVITDGRAVAPVQAINAGKAGNCEEGTVLNMTAAIVGVQAAAAADAGGIVGGFDRESVDDLRERVGSFQKQPPLGGAKSDYETWAKEVPGVTRAWCYPMEMGPGTVVVRCVMDNKEGTLIPSESELKAVSDYLADKVPATVEEYYVAAPTQKPVNVVINDLSPDTDEIKEAIRTNLENLFLAAEPGRTVKLNAIRNAVITATEDHVLVSPAADILTTEKEIATLGSITYGVSA